MSKQKIEDHDDDVFLNKLTDKNNHKKQQQITHLLLFFFYLSLQRSYEFRQNLFNFFFDFIYFYIFNFYLCFFFLPRIQLSASGFRLELNRKVEPNKQQT